MLIKNTVILLGRTVADRFQQGLHIAHSIEISDVVNITLHLVRLTRIISSTTFAPRNLRNWRVINNWCVIIIITGPPTHSVGVQTSNDGWCLSSSVVCRRLSSSSVKPRPHQQQCRSNRHASTLLPVWTGLNAAA